MKPTPLQAFLHAVEWSATDGYFPIVLQILKGKFDVGQMDDAMVPPGKLDKLYLAAEVQVKSHPSRDRIIEVMQLVQERYLDLWRCILAHEAGFMQGDWNREELHKSLLASLDGLRRYRDVEGEAEKPRKYVTADQAQRIAEEKYEKLWRINNQQEWARQLDCNRKTVPKLKAWQDAKRRRQSWRKVETRLKGTVDPKIIEALHTSDASVLGSLSEADRDRLDSMTDADRAELIELLSEQARDAIS